MRAKLTRQFFHEHLQGDQQGTSMQRAADVEDQLRSDIVRTLVRADASALRIITGTCKHVARRAHEMRDAAQRLDKLGFR